MGPSPTNASSERISGKSVAVTTARMPAIARALLQSMRTIPACACGLRLIYARHRRVGAKIGAAGHLVHPVRPDGAGTTTFNVSLLATDDMRFCRLSEL